MPHLTGPGRRAAERDEVVGVAVGRLTYDSTLSADFDDRLLAHLQVVIGAKLRRGESFQFTWKDDPAVGDGRSTLWLDESVPLSFKYSGSKPPRLNAAWIEALMATANSVDGLRLVPEPPDPNRSG